jgi:hypothetical protein
VALTLSMLRDTFAVRYLQRAAISELYKSTWISKMRSPSNTTRTTVTMLAHLQRKNADRGCPGSRKPSFKQEPLALNVPRNRARITRQDIEQSGRYFHRDHELQVEVLLEVFFLRKWGNRPDVTWEDLQKSPQQRRPV